MSFLKIFPRDFFNTAKLLKCHGLLSLKILDKQLPEGISIECTEDLYSDFNVEHCEEWDILYISNVSIYVNNESYHAGTNYNSKDNFPFVIIVNDEEITIFNEQGDFTADFINKFSL